MATYLKIMTWNLGYGSPGSTSLNNKETVKKALAYCHGNGAQVVLAQEMYIPHGINEREVVSFDDVYKYCIFSYVPTDRPEGGKWKGNDGSNKKNENRTNKWGTAILSMLPLENVNFTIKASYPGLITAARIGDLNLISMYAKGGMDKILDTEKKSGTYTYHEMLHFCIEDLSSILFENKVVLSGDWNIGYYKNSSKTTKASEAVLARLNEFKLEDNFPMKTYKKTYHSCGTRRESHADWVFVSEALANCSKSYVDTTSGVEAYSDHYPIVTELNI